MGKSSPPPTLSDIDIKRMEEEAAERRRELINTIVPQFLNGYLPAADWQQSTIQYTTGQLCRAIADHTGILLLEHEIYICMVEHNYQSGRLDGLERVWLLREVS